jgi:hypothetical protein
MNSKEKLLKQAKNRQQRKERFQSFRRAQHNFDRRFRYFERKSRFDMCEMIENLQTQDPKQFWNQLKTFGPKKKKTIPLEIHTDDNEISSDPNAVLSKWKHDFHSCIMALAHSVLQMSKHQWK